MTETRMRTLENVQSQNKRRRFKKNWIKTNKRLEEIIETKHFNSKDDYLKLLPELPDTFSSKDLEEKIGKKNNPNLILWVFAHMNIIKHVESQGRKKFYRIT